MLRTSRSVVLLVVFLFLGLSFSFAGLNILHRGSLTFRSQDGTVQVLSSAYGAHTYYRIIAATVGIGVLSLAVSTFLALRITRAVREGGVVAFPPMSTSRLILVVLAVILILLAIIFRHGVHI
jgi:hypothetical protein